jgi:DNA-binding GntR family transcriptional regulator
MSPATMAHLAYRHILDRMLANELKPGDWIDRRQIATELKASLMPIAEAVQRLTAEGFLVAVARRGTQVRVPNREDVRGQLLVREAIECQAAWLSCGAPVQAEHERLRALAEKADHPSPDDPSPWQTDLRFHRALVALTACPALIDAFDRIMNMALFQHTALLTPYPNNQGDSHRALLDDLATPDADRASARVRKHIRTAKDHLFAPAQSG